MKHFKILSYLAFISIALLVTSCSSDEELINQPVDSDLQPELRHFFMGDNDFTFITPCEAQQGINVFIPDCFNGTPYEVAIPDALQEYNNAPIAVNYNIVEDIGEADLIFECNQGGECGFANAAFPDPDNSGDSPPNGQTTFPSGGTIGSGISLDVNWIEANCLCSNAELDNCFFMRTVMHELAHTLGFYHNDQVGESAIHVDGTPLGFDPESIINSGGGEFGNGTFCGAGICAFNENDLLALQTLYPIIDITISPKWEEKGCVPANTTIIVCAYGYEEDQTPDMNFTWSFNGSFFPFAPNNNFDQKCVKVNVGEEGGYISVWAEDEECGLNSRNREIIICDDGPQTPDGPTTTIGIIEK